MKKLLVVLACVWLAGCAGDQPPGKPQDATAFFKSDFDKLMAAWSTLDPSKAAPFYAKDPNLTFFDVAPLAYKGWQEYEDGVRKSAADYESAQWAIEPDFRANQLGNIAWVSFTATYTLTPKSGAAMKGTARFTDVLEKRGEKWLIVHEHVSVPMAQAQHKAVKAHKAKAATHAKAKAKKHRK